MKKIFYALLFLSFLTSCEKDANIKLDEMPPTPVIEGYFSNFAPDSHFKITMSKGFQRDSYEYEPVTDAQLYITDSQGNQINFYPDNDGIYRTTTNGIPGETYTLHLNKDTHQLTALSTMPEIVPLNDFKFVQITQDNGVTYKHLKIYFNDPENQVDYYMVKIFFESSGYYYDESERYFDDSSFNRGEHSLIVPFYFNGSGTYKVKLFHLNKAYIDYLNTLDQLIDMEYGENPFQIIVPGHPETNVKGGIGYFATVASDSLVKQIN